METMNSIFWKASIVFARSGMLMIGFWREKNHPRAWYGSPVSTASRISWNTPSLSGTSGYFHGTPSSRRAVMRGYGGCGGTPTVTAYSSAKMQSPCSGQMPIRALSTAMARSVWKLLMKLLVRQPGWTKA